MKGENLWCYPMLPSQKYGVQLGTGFLDPLYYLAIKAQHSGVDVNKWSGGNSDLGDPIYSVSNGIVQHVKWHAVWGWIVVIYYPGANVWVQYAHFDKVGVRVGQEVRVGQVIGTCGRGALNRYVAHLHFEVRTVGLDLLPADFWESTTMNARDAKAHILKTRVDPLKFLAKVGARRNLSDLRAAML